MSVNVFGQIVKADIHKLNDLMEGYYVNSYYDSNEDVCGIKVFLKEGTFGRYEFADSVSVIQQLFADSVD